MQTPISKVGLKKGTKPKKKDIEEDIMKTIKNECNKPEMENSLLLDHLGDYRQEPFDLLQSYFEGRPLARLVRHQIESYNNFVNFQLQRTIEMFNPVVIKSEADYNPETNTYGLIINISLKNDDGVSKFDIKGYISEEFIKENSDDLLDLNSSECTDQLIAFVKKSISV